MDIAEQIITGAASDGGSPWGELDDYGLPVKFSDHVDYTVARIIARHPDICVNPHDNGIYLLDSNSRLPVKENSRTVMELSNFASPFKGDRSVLVFNRLREVLPKIDMESVAVGDGLVFDGRTHALKETLTKKQTEARYRGITALLNEMKNNEMKNNERKEDD